MDFNIFALMKKLIYTCWIVAITSLTGLIAQDSNPFELKYRLKTNVVEIVEQDITPKETKITLSSNPFDIKKGSEIQEDVVASTVVIPTIQKIKKEKGEDFLFWILILDLLFLSVVINLNRSTLVSIFKAVRNDSFMSLLAKTSNAQSKLQYNLYFILYIINVGLFLYLSLKTQWGIQGVAWIFKSIGLVLGIYIIRHISLKLLSHIYPVKREVTVFRYTIIIFGAFIMLFLVPINFCLSFVPEVFVQPFIYFGLILIVGSYVLRQLRGVFIGINHLTQSPSHFFLYLCTFEIAPFIIGYRFFETMG